MEAFGVSLPANWGGHDCEAITEERLGNPRES